MKRIIVILGWIGLLALPVVGQTLRYTVSMPQPATHYYEVTLRMDTGGKSQVRLVMPVWTPGSYRVREYARNVQEFSARGPSFPLWWRKINKYTWEIDTAQPEAPPTKQIEVRYRVYANELGVRSSHLDDQHGYFNGAALFMYLEGQKDQPYRVTLVPAADWKIATGLDPVPGEKNTFEAPDYDILVDCPVEMGRFETVEFQVRGVPHRVVIHGPTRFDRSRMAGDFQRLVEKQAEMMGGIPYKNYTFILHAGLAGGGGLEHLNSTSIQTSRLSFRRERDWEDFLDLVSHEFFHLWNVKRIRPQVLGPFDYTQENYTSMLWVSEGVSDYYCTLFLARAGLITPKRYLERLAELIQNYRRTPGRLVQSAADSSFDSWIKFYQQDENSPNSQISYYDKGALLGLILDMEIRSRTDNAKTLDDLMRFLNDNYAKKGKGFSDMEFRQAVEQVFVGRNWDTFFGDYTSGTAELPLENYLRLAGLVLGEKKPPEETSDREALDTIYLGIRTARSGERTTISSVLAGSPAYRDGLNSGDELLAFDGIRVGDSDYVQRLRDYKPSDTVEVTVFRFNQLRSFRVTLAPPLPLLEITRAENPSETQKKMYESWLQTKW